MSKSRKLVHIIYIGQSRSPTPESARGANHLSGTGNGNPGRCPRLFCDCPIRGEDMHSATSKLTFRVGVVAGTSAQGVTQTAERLNRRRNSPTERNKVQKSAMGKQAESNTESQAGLAVARGLELGPSLAIPSERMRSGRLRRQMPHGRGGMPGRFTLLDGCWKTAPGVSFSLTFRGPKLDTQCATRDL
jgi:hypothetical protein